MQNISRVSSGSLQLFRETIQPPPRTLSSHLISAVINARPFRRTCVRARCIVSSLDISPRAILDETAKPDSKRETGFRSADSRDQF
jgi:hypothetical protein